MADGRHLTADLSNVGQARSRLPGLRMIFGTIIVILVGVVTILPVSFAVVGSFNAAPVGEPWLWGIAPWEKALSSGRTLWSLVYSFVMTIRVPMALLVGFVIAWLLVRVEIPGKEIIEACLWIAYFLPSLPVAVGWVLLLHEQYGLVNRLLMTLPFIDGPVFNVNSVGGILWAHLSVTTIPVMMILLAPALKQLDASLEQSARVCGSGNFRTLWRILIPVLAPALMTSLVAGMIRGLEAFEIEQLLGIPAGIYVYPTRVYDLINFDPPDFPQAMALSTLLLAILFGMTVVYQSYMERVRHTTIGGRGVTFVPVRVGNWAKWASGACFLYILFGIAAPLALLVVGSFMKLFGFFDIDGAFTLSQWSRVLSDTMFLRALVNSLIVGFAVASLGLLLYAFLAYAIVRSRLPFKSVLSLLAWLPWSVPGILLGMAFLWLLLAVPGLNLLYGTLAALVVVLIVQSMPLGIQMLRTSFAQVGDELEQASSVCGASWLVTYRRIMLPLIAPMLASIFILTFMHALRDVSATILLSSANTRPLSLLMMEYAGAGNLEAAAVIGVILSAIAILLTALLRRTGLHNITR